MRRTFALIAALAISSCTTALAPQAESIKTTRNPSDVADCKSLAIVEAQPPYMWPGDDLKQLKKQAAPLGADTIFVTGRVNHVVGVAYRCAK